MGDTFDFVNSGVRNMVDPFGLTSNLIGRNSGGSGGGNSGPGGAYDGMAQYPGYGQGGAGSMAYENLISQATSPGDSPWAIKSKNALDLGTKDALDKARATTAGTTAQAMDGLASRGGLSTGARERIQEGGQKSFLDMSQNLNKANDLNFANMQVQDANQKNNMLSAATTAELAKARDMNDYNMRKYEADMGAWAADKTAKATANSGKK